MIQLLGKDERENCVLINNVNRTNWSAITGIKSFFWSQNVRLFDLKWHVLFQTCIIAWDDVQFLAALLYRSLNTQQPTRGFKFFISQYKNFIAAVGGS